MASSQDLIQQLMQAEQRAEELVASAKKARQAKLKQARDKADEELAVFKQEQERKFQNEVGAKENADPAAELSSATRQEAQAVQKDYQQNKDKTVQFIVERVLEVPTKLGWLADEVLQLGQATVLAVSMLECMDGEQEAVEEGVLVDVMMDAELAVLDAARAMTQPVSCPMLELVGTTSKRLRMLMLDEVQAISKWWGCQQISGAIYVCVSFHCCCCFSWFHYCCICFRR